MVPLSGEDVEFATTANNPPSNGPASGAALNNLVVPTGSPKTVGNLTNASDKNLIVPANASIAVNSVVSIKKSWDKHQLYRPLENPDRFGC